MLKLKTADGSTIVVPAGNCRVDEGDEETIVAWDTTSGEQRARLSTDMLSSLLARRELVYVSW